MWPYKVKFRPYRNYNRRRQVVKQTEDQKRRNERNTLGTRNYTSANQSLNGNKNQFNSDYDRRNRNIIHKNSYQRGIIPIECDNSGFQVVHGHKRKDRTLDLADDFDIWLQRKSPLE